MNWSITNTTVLVLLGVVAGTLLALLVVQNMTVQLTATVPLEIDITDFPQPPTPVPAAPPSFAAGYQTRWVCTDLMDTRTNYFDGNEVVQGGAVTAAGATGYELAPSSDGSVDHAFFSINGAGVLSVAALGADNLYGLEEGLYVVDVLAANTSGEDRAQVVIRVVLGVNAAQDGSGCTL